MVLSASDTKIKIFATSDNEDILSNDGLIKPLKEFEILNLRWPCKNYEPCTTDQFKKLIDDSSTFRFLEVEAPNQSIES
jgi:hypothetical protein